jgi:hypothetical protein
MYRRSTTSRVSFLSILAALFAGTTAFATCALTTITVGPPTPGTHNAYSLTDPGGQQVAVFDIQWGGALASLKLNGVQMAWGSQTGGMVQPAMHTYPNGADYNPTQAGDNLDHGSPVVGALCVNSNTLTIMTGGLLDYNKGLSGHIVADAVNNSTVVSGSYSTPYTVFTTATFVATGGTPSYYLQLQQTIANIDPTENYSWGFELAAYAPYTFSNYVSYPASCTSSAPCAAASTPHLLGGVYPNTGLTGGLAVYIAPETYLLGYNSQVFVDAGADNVNDNQSTHLFDANWTLPPSSSRTFTWYVMAGDWTPALNFALSH